MVDGQLRTIVVDDYFPFTTTKYGKEIFAFAKNKPEQNELWVQLLEKAWAKLCGSYEQTEMGRTSEFFQNFDGSPCDILWTDDYMSEQGKEKLFRIFHKAMHEDYIICASIQKKMKEAIKDKEKYYLPEKLGLKNCHSYHIIKI